MIKFKVLFLTGLLIAVVTTAWTGSKNLNVPKIREMLIRTNVTNRYATTMITSKVENCDIRAREAVFLVILPEKAFISEFSIEIEGKIYNAYVKEKEEATRIYKNAVSRGQNAAHVAVSARNSNKFTVSLNIGPKSKAKFKLKYEELLERQQEKYEFLLNIYPGQIVPKLEVLVVIDESLPLTFVRVPSLRSGSEVPGNNIHSKPNTEIIKINEVFSIVKFFPDVDEQIKLARAFNAKETEGLKGQFVVEYDVERKSKGGEVLLKDGYFVHFFAPEELEIIPTQVMFVLDISGSMSGRKIQQLIDAMVKILGNLREHDSFGIVTFSTSVQVWNLQTNSFIDLHLNDENNYGNLENILRGKKIPEPVKATAENIEAAKAFVKTIRNEQLTNIIGGLEVGLHILKNAPKNCDYQQPLLVFLTDGVANVGISDVDSIINTVAKLNPVDKQIPIYSLSFGSGADKNFLRKLSSKNLGFSRHIYEATDSALQLQDFFQLISSPLLRDITFRYAKNSREITTKNEFPIFFKGSELVVAGAIPMGSTHKYTVEGWRPTGVIEMKPRIIETDGSLERLWAYLQIRQILNERDVADQKTELSKRAVDLALKYSFVTPVTSLVVVKPHDIIAVNTEYISTEAASFGSKNHADSPLRFNSNGFSPQRHLPLPNRYCNQPIDNLVDFGTPAQIRPTLPCTKLLITTDVPMTPKQNFSVLQELQKRRWFKSVMIDNFTIKIENVFYKLATNETRSYNYIPEACRKTVTNKAGSCTPIHMCETATPFLTDYYKFLDVFCSIEV